MAEDKENTPQFEEEFSASSLTSSTHTTPSSSNQVSPEDTKKKRKGFQFLSKLKDKAFGDVTNQPDIASPSTPNDSAKKKKRAKTPKTPKTPSQPVVTEEAIIAAQHSLISPNKDTLHSKKKLQKELFRLTDWLSGMEENQIEYAKELVSYREQIETLTKEKENLKQENEELKEKLRSLTTEQEQKTTEKWKEHMADQFKLSSLGFYDD